MLNEGTNVTARFIHYSASSNVTVKDKNLPRIVPHPHLSTMTTTVTTPPRRPPRSRPRRPRRSSLARVRNPPRGSPSTSCTRRDHIFSLDHTRASIDALCRAIAPFAPTWRWVRDGFDGTGSIARAIAVRAGMVALVMRPISSSRRACANGARVARREKIRADFERARARGEVDREAEAVMEMKTRREEVTFGQEEATAIMEATATATERLASVAEWRSRTVSAAAMYAAMVMSVMSLFIPARTVMCWGLLYATRPKRMRVVPDPLTSCWSRLPTKAREASKIQ